MGALLAVQHPGRRVPRGRLARQRGITAAAASQPTAMTDSIASGTATTGVMPSWCAKTCQHSLPHAIPAEDTDHQGHPGQRDSLPAERAADLP